MEALHSCYLFMDRNKIGQAISNILSTSFELTPAYGNITVSVQILPATAATFDYHGISVGKNINKTSSKITAMSVEYVLVVKVEDTSRDIDYVCIFYTT